MRNTVNTLIALLCSAYLVAAFALDVNISGTVTKNGGGALEGATVSLAKVKGISAKTDAEGKFALKGSVGIMLQMNSPQVALLEFKGNILMVSPASGTIHGTIDVYSGNGRKIVSLHLSSIQAGKQSITLPAFRPGLNIVRVTLESEPYTCRLVRLGRDLYIKNEAPSAFGDAHFMLGKQASSVKDTLIVTKAGFDTKKAPIESYTLSGVAVTVDSSNTASDAKEASCTMALPTTKYAEWPSNAKFPDPFKMKDGTRMSKKSQWCEQRAYLSSLLQATSLGLRNRIR